MAEVRRTPVHAFSKFGVRPKELIKQGSDATENACTVARRRIIFFCHGLLGLLLIQSYQNFSPGVPFFHIPQSVGDFAQSIPPVDDGRYFSRLQQIAHEGQVLFDRSRDEHDELLAHES